MKAATTMGTNTVAIMVLGVLALVLAASILNGTRLPILSSERAAFFGLFVLGMGMCTMGMQFERFGWTHPISIAGIVLGALALAVVGAVLFRLNLPFVDNERNATMTLGAIMVVKIVLALARG
jgi:hypothetical protein